MYTVINQVTLSQLSQHSLGLSFSSRQVIAASCVVATLACAFSNSFQARICSSGALAVLIACMMIVATGWELPVRANSVVVVGDLAAAPLVVSLVTFTVASQPVLPTFFSSAKSQESFDRGCILAWALWTMAALALCIFCSIIFGESLQEVMLNNVGRSLDLKMLPNGKRLSWIMAVWMTIRLQTGMAVLTRPHTELVAKYCGVALSEDRSGAWEMLLAMPVFLVIGAIAIHFSEFVLLLENFCGAFLMGINGFIFPGCVYLRVCRPKRFWDQFGAVFAVVFGLLVFFAPLWSI